MFNVFSLIAMVLLLSVGVGLTVVLCSLIGEIARQRNHPISLH
jgi:hypothetical protein